MNRFFIANTVFLLTLSAQTNAETAANPALCDATIAALKAEWDESVKNFPQDERMYNQRIEFTKLHRDLFKKAVTLYDPAAHNQFVSKARELQQNRHIQMTEDMLELYVEPLDSNASEEKGLALIAGYLCSYENGDVDFISSICIGKKSEGGVDCRSYETPPIPILKKGLPAPKTGYSTGMVDDLMKQYAGPPPPDHPDFRDFIAKKLAEKHLCCPGYTPVAANTSNGKENSLYLAAIQAISPEAAI